MKMGIDWLLGEMDQNKNLFPEGYGIMEVYGLNAELIDVAVYTQQALEAAAHIAEVLKDTEGKDRYRKLASDLKARINHRFWIEQDGTYGDFYGSRSQAVSAAQGAIKQIGLKGADKLTRRDKDLIAHYERLESEFSAMPEADRAWITNKNWVIATPMETGIAPRARAIELLDKIRRENSGPYGPYLSAVERRSMMTISTGVQAVAESKYGRSDEAMWYVNEIVQTFNRVSPGSISEMMPDHGCFTIAWTSYGIVVPLIEHVFGIRPDAGNKTIVFEPHLPAGWENISIEDLPIGANFISFSRTRTGKGVIYDIESKEDGWSLILREKVSPDTRYFLNGRPMQSFVFRNPYGWDKESGADHVREITLTHRWTRTRGGVRFWRFEVAVERRHPFHPSSGYHPHVRPDCWRYQLRATTAPRAGSAINTRLFLFRLQKSWRRTSPLMLRLELRTTQSLGIAGRRR